MLRIISLKKHDFKEKRDYCGKFSYEYEGTEEGKIICKDCKDCKEN